MGLLEVARDTLKEIPMSDILRERLSLALDQSSDAQRQIAALQTDYGSLKAQLERERSDHEITKQELQELKDKHAEEIRIFRMIEFRRGKRTGGVWAPFCPKCHAPALTEGEPFVRCTDGNCKWYTMVSVNSLEEIIGKI
jgi:hypothetical protein